MDIWKPFQGVGAAAKAATTERTARIPLTAEERLRCETVPRMSDLTWRIFRIMAEFVEGFQFLSTMTKEVTIFGSARLPEGSRWYEEAHKLGRLLGEKKYTVITGGGPGIMEAANKGAYETGAVSVGLNIQLPSEQRINPYVTRGMGFHYFFTRRVMLAASAQAYVYFPGGFGTLDELFEILTLIQTKKSERIAVILVGHDYWDPLVAWLRESVLGKFDGITAGDLELFTVVDYAQEAFTIIESSKERTIF